jgi:hypothetical protein
MWGYGLGRAVSGKRQVAYTLECGSEHACSIKCGKYLDKIQTG